jgi:bifunctional UDP-N-acetylglucosamine pyrophosphorylase/glucosamine-1-phosphate N-acetyltransferase
MKKQTASVILAAGRGTRMKGFDGNKTLLPLVPHGSPFEGAHPILVHILQSLPPGPKAVVVHHRKEDVMALTRPFGLTYCEQERLNGTGGALLAASPFIAEVEADHVIVTMGDVPLVNRTTYERITGRLDESGLVVLAFRPRHKRQYGVLEIDRDRVARITEWKYWKDYPPERQEHLQICNSGIYAASRTQLMFYLDLLASRPHRVHKTIGGELKEVEEFFITDLVQLMADDGRRVAFELVSDEKEVMGVDDIQALVEAQAIFSLQVSGPTSADT